MIIYDTDKNAVIDSDEIVRLYDSVNTIDLEKVYNTETTTATIATSDWYARFCAVEVDGVCENSKVIVYPDSASKIEYDSCGVYCSAIGNGYIMLTAETAPSSALTVTIEYSKDNGLTRGQTNSRINGFIMGTMRYNLLSTLPVDNYGSGNKSGLLYSSAGAEDKFIGINVSLYTFLSVVKNPYSMLYTTESKSYTGDAYYGTVCTGLVCASWGLPIIITTACFEKGNYITKLGAVNKITDFKVGDMLLYNGHACMIVDVADDLSRIVTAESTRWVSKINTYNSLSAFRRAWGSYQVCRYDKIDNVEYMMGDCYINPSSYDHTEIDFPDIMTNFGDKCVLLPTDSVELDVLDSTDYTSITVYKDDEVLDTYEVATTITLGNLSAGDYKAVMTGGGIESTCYWTIADVSASLNANILTFSSSNCTPVWVTGHPEQITDSDGYYTQWNNMKQESRITEAEASAGVKNISELLADSDVVGLIKVHFAHKYGVVTAKISL